MSVFEGDDGAARLTVLDPSGRGADAEPLGDFVSEALHELLRAGITPRTTLRCINQVLLEQRGSGAAAFAAAAIAVLDPRRRVVTFASAGHVEGFRFLPDGRHAHYSSTGPLLGVIDDAQHEHVTFDYACGDVLVLVTDGLLDARKAGAETERLGTAGICRIVHSHLASSGGTCAGRIVADVRKIAGGVLADDAVALVAKL
ncbi:MAG TPA: PP2C family protein-serine/threonine phosphatase [Candidatus Limnocylindria bacterium]|nr:PP2C family protein-serine/threonine phosphatase [Candidatus Limnocylindria bacterium]